MNIGDKITELSKELTIPCYYIKRPEDINKCIVYTYIEMPNLIADNKELTAQYTILFNIYCTSNVEKTKNIIKEALEKHGFKKKIIVGTVLEENNIYNTAMQYTISL
ncbi:hypothetical protein [Clostridium sp. ZS2]|uniref:hypothetical protein n=1 Tax=Clostridium sp. ZS2 TaxID=2949988 RepID=UPI00207B0228|nr:hypothetical protein [Clostridium sp. ZS2]